MPPLPNPHDRPFLREVAELIDQQKKAEEEMLQKQFEIQKQSECGIPLTSNFLVMSGVMWPASYKLASGTGCVYSTGRKLTEKHWHIEQLYLDCFSG